MVYEIKCISSVLFFSVVECSDECSSCKVDDTRYCTACKTPGMLLLEGDCVQRCRDGTFPSHDLQQCQGNH